jgi:hypothetical protein
MGRELTKGGKAQRPTIYQCIREQVVQHREHHAGILGVCESGRARERVLGHSGVKSKRQALTAVEKGQAMRRPHTSAMGHTAQALPGTRVQAWTRLTGTYPKEAAWPYAQALPIAQRLSMLCDRRCA